MKSKRATARVYKWEMITIHFEQPGKSFAKRQPYHDVFYYTLNQLKKYGFEWGLNPTYEKHYKALSQYHRRAIDKRKNLIVDFEINAKGIFERIRWHTDKPNHEGKSTFKLNNNYTAIYARMFHACYPEHAGFFRTRHQISEKAPATGLPEFSPEKIKSCN